MELGRQGRSLHKSTMYMLILIQYVLAVYITTMKYNNLRQKEKVLPLGNVRLYINEVEDSESIMRPYNLILQISFFDLFKLRFNK